MPAAIHFQSEAFSTSRKMMGRNAAGESFLRGLVRARPSDEMWAVTESRQEGENFTRTVRSLGATGDVHLIGPGNMHELRGPGTLFFPSPTFARQAWRRSLFDSRAWSICGITHTTASDAIVNGLADLLTAPVQPWDAVICTSNAVKAHVETVIGAQAAYLTDRFGASHITLPALPVIPLGINTDDFLFSAEERAAGRARLRIEDDEDAVLYVGRLAFHAKAHPLAMYQALELAQNRRVSTGRRTVLVECGWFAGDAVRQAFDDARRASCPSIRSIVVDGRIAEDRRAAWACADIACSLVDNIQETFGIVPVEAMAAGLPVVVSDWNGYRDSVRNEVDGFLIPTITPGPGHGRDLTQRYALGLDNYDYYIGRVAAFNAVDIDATASALSKLLDDPGIRRRMGENGQRRARDGYDWRTIIARYEALWGELAERRAAGPAPTTDRHRWPAYPDPFQAFAAYPTAQLTDTSVVRLVPVSASEAIDRLRQLLELRMVSFASQVLPELDDLNAMLTRLDSGPMPVAILTSQDEGPRQTRSLRALTWLMKLGIVSIDSSQE